MCDDWTTHAPYVQHMADLDVVPTEYAELTAHEGKLVRPGLREGRARWLQQSGVG